MSCFTFMQVSKALSLTEVQLGTDSKFVTKPFDATCSNVPVALVSINAVDHNTILLGCVLVGVLMGVLAVF